MCPNSRQFQFRHGITNYSRLHYVDHYIYTNTVHNEKIYSSKCYMYVFSTVLMLEKSCSCVSLIMPWRQIPVLKHRVMMIHGEWIYIYTFSTFVLHRVKWSASCPCFFIHSQKRRPQYPLIGWGGPRASLDEVVKWNIKPQSPSP